MSQPISESPVRRSRPRLALLALTVSAVLHMAAEASAQTVPYQSSRAASIGKGLGQSALPQGGVFEPRVEAAVQYVSNIDLADHGEPQTDTAGLELAPGFYASLSSGNVLAAIDYSLIGRAWEDSDYNDISHRLTANGQWIANPEWFAIRGDATYRDGIVDPGSGLNYGGLGIFGTANLQEVATASANPVLKHRFGDLEFSADYRYGRVWYLDQGKGQEPSSTIADRDSTDQSANANIGTARAGSRLYGALFYNWQKSEYDNTLLPYEFERAGLAAGLQISQKITLVGDVGVETDLARRAATGGLDAEFWSAGLRWEPNERTSAEARYGNRSYGESYSFSASHRARILEFVASYREQPMVQTRRLSLGDIVPGELPPDVSDAYLGIFNSLPYISRSAQAGVSARGSRTKMGISAFWYEREYLVSERGRSDETVTGASFNASRRLASNLSADFDVIYRQYERMFAVNEVAPADDKDTQVIFRLNRTSGEKLTLTGEAGYLTRTGASDFDAWWVGMRARWTP